MATKRWLKMIAIGASIGVASGSYYSYTNYQRYMSIKAASVLKTSNMEITKMPNVKPTYHIEGPTKLSFGVTLFQYCSCPFCCKARAFLNYFGVDHNIVEVDPVFRNKLSWSNYKKVPTLIVHSQADDISKSDKAYQINDSSVIISSLGSFLLSKRKVDDQKNHCKSIEDLAAILNNYQTVEIDDGDGKKRNDIPNKYFLMLGDIGGFELEKRESSLAEERRWRDWADSVLVHSLSPNIYRTIPEAFQAFKNFSKMGNWEEHFTSVQRGAAIYLGSTVMWMVGKKLKKKYNLKNDVRESLYDNCRLWMKAVGSRKYMGGSQPNLADLSVFGVLSSIEGCEAFTDVLENTNIGPWYEAMKECCKNHTGRDLIQSI